jgi:hypothetical protein
MRRISNPSRKLTLDLYKVFHFEVSISAPRWDLGSKYQQILTRARARSIWDFQPLGAKATAMPVDFLTHSTLNLRVKAHQKMMQRPIVAYLSLKGMSVREIHDDIVATLEPDGVSYSSVQFSYPLPSRGTISSFLLLPSFFETRITSS